MAVVVGLGHVGLPTALALVDAGLRVVGLDTSQRRLAEVAAGDVALDASGRANLREALAGPLSCTGDARVLAGADVVLICVPTPTGPGNEPDLGPLHAACADVVAHARSGQLLLLTSTVHVGATRDLLAVPLAARGLVAGRDVHVAFAPERIDPGNTSYDPRDVPRVIGGITQECSRRAAATLGALSPVHVVSSPEAAELSKLHENTYRAVNIAYALDLADAARAYGLDVTEVIDATATKPFGFAAFRPGPGAGGHCIPCDPHYLLSPLAARGADLPVVRTAMDRLHARPAELFARVLQLLEDAGAPRRGARVLVVGVAYKPGVGDTRGAPGIGLLERLAQAGVEVAYHDPLVPAIEVAGLSLASVADPDPAEQDLVVLVCVHPGTAPFWARPGARVLDATYRADAGEGHRAVL